MYRAECRQRKEQLALFAVARFAFGVFVSQHLNTRAQGICFCTQKIFNVYPTGILELIQLFHYIEFLITHKSKLMENFASIPFFVKLPVTDIFLLN